ncbi:hypothetical protein ACFYPC_25685 [Streptomyces sp. NPDC005808]
MASLAAAVSAVSAGLSGGRTSVVVGGITVGSPDLDGNLNPLLG